MMTDDHVPPDVLTADAFEDVIGSTFEVLDDDGPPITLTAVRRLPTTPGHPRAEPFALDLTRPGDARGQTTLPLRHDALGELVLFVVPVGREGDVTRYEAIFN
jgi:hypothetical protein